MADIVVIPAYLVNAGEEDMIYVDVWNSVCDKIWKGLNGNPYGITLPKKAGYSTDKANQPPNPI